MCVGLTRLNSRLGIDWHDGMKQKEKRSQKQRRRYIRMEGGIKETQSGIDFIKERQSVQVGMMDDGGGIK